MGGGSEQEWSAVEETEDLAAQTFQLCDSVAYGISLKEERACLENDYSHLDGLLASIGDQMPFVVANCAAHVTTIQRLRQLANRYKELEVATYGHLEGAHRLGEGILTILLSTSPAEDRPDSPSDAEVAGGAGAAAAPRTMIVRALSLRTLSSTCLRQALSLVVERMQTVAQMLMATAAAHIAVSRDMDVLVCDAANIVEDPLKSDIGLQAAPAIGATVAGTLGLVLLRGALGPVGALALGSLGGAIGAKELTQTKIVPQVKEAFQRVYDEASQVSSLIDSKASALDVIAADLMSASVLLEQLLDVSAHPSPVRETQLASLAEDLSQSLAALQLRCSACRHRLTAFMALTYKLKPKASTHKKIPMVVFGASCPKEDGLKSL